MVLRYKKVQWKRGKQDLILKSCIWALHCMNLYSGCQKSSASLPPLQDLACRLFTDLGNYKFLSNIGTPRWEQLFAGGVWGMSADLLWGCAHPPPSCGGALSSFSRDIPQGIQSPGCKGDDPPWPKDLALKPSFLKTSACGIFPLSNLMLLNVLLCCECILMNAFVFCQSVARYRLCWNASRSKFNAKRVGVC